MSVLYILAAVLATGRLTEIITIERISAPLRKRWPFYIWTCSRCVSVWCGILCTIAYVYAPTLNIPLALSAAYILLSQAWLRVVPGIIIPNEAHIRKLALTVDAAGAMRLIHSDFDRDALISIFQHLIGMPRETRETGEVVVTNGRR